MKLVKIMQKCKHYFLGFGESGKGPYQNYVVTEGGGRGLASGDETRGGGRRRRRRNRRSGRGTGREGRGAAGRHWGSERQGRGPCSTLFMKPAEREHCTLCVGHITIAT